VGDIPAHTAGFAFTINDVAAPVASGFHHGVGYEHPEARDVDRE